MTAWSRMDLADEIARDHIAWARRHGFSPQHFRSIIPARGAPIGWDDVRFALGSLWLSIPETQLERIKVTSWRNRVKKMARRPPRVAP